MVFGANFGGKEHLHDSLADGVQNDLIDLL